MAVIKVFDSKGVKTVEPLGNVTEQDYDPEVDTDLIDTDDTSEE